MQAHQNDPLTWFERAEQILHSRFPPMDMSVSHSNLLEDSLKVVETLLPSWSKEQLSFHVCTDGITNKRCI
jgi:hypothetical protein